MLSWAGDALLAWTPGGWLAPSLPLGACRTGAWRYRFARLCCQGLSPLSNDRSNVAHAGSKAEGRLCLKGGRESTAQHRGAGRAVGMWRGGKEVGRGRARGGEGVGRKADVTCAAKALPSMRNETRGDGSKVGEGLSIPYRGAERMWGNWGEGGYILSLALSSIVLPSCCLSRRKKKQTKKKKKQNKTLLLPLMKRQHQQL